MRRLLLALLLLSVLAGCTGPGEAGNEDAGTVLDVHTVEPQDTTHDKAGLRMTRDNGMARLAVYGGKQATGGYGVTIEEVRRRGDTIIVDAVFAAPDSDAVVTQAFTYPADAVRFPLERGAYRVRLTLRGDANRTLERTVVLR